VRAAMFQIGDSLREARTRRGLSSADVQKGIRIRERYLTALEEERWDMLPGEAYTKGFLRTYAEFLGLNGQLYIDEFNSRLRAHEEEPLVPESLAPPRRPSSGVLRALVGVLVVGAAVAGLAAWRLGGSSTPNHPARAPVAPTAAHADAAKAKTHAPPAAAVAAKPVSAVIRAARGRSWLLVRAGGPSGTKLYEGVLEQGTTMRFPVTTQLWVRMGRPWVVDIRVGSRSISPQGQSPQNVTLTKS
jgi:cytoskeleton protein RodZ